MIYSDIYGLLGNIVNKYIVNYLSGKLIIRGENNSDPEGIDEQESNIFLASSVGEFIRAIEGEDRLVIEDELIGIDGSSRSLVLMNGLLSVGAVSAYSSISGILGIYPSLNGIKSLDIEAPFIAISPSFKYDSSTLEPYIYSSKFIMTNSLDGSLFIGCDPNRLETELRFVLETQTLVLFKDKKFVIIDGPLFPSFISLTKGLRDRINQVRIRSVGSNTIGIVKRLDKSRLLINVLSMYRNDIVNKYKIDPLRYLSDESFLFDMIRFNENPPYKRLLVGPILKLFDNFKIYINYLIVPIHSFLPKFAILRIESLVNDQKLFRTIANLPITSDGVPNIIAIPDRTSKTITAGLIKFIRVLLETSGVNSSFRSRIEAVNT